jgi:hypothetical protein
LFEDGVMLLADNWCVKVDERIYGPYPSPQLRKFAHEGRLAAWSLVAPAGSRSWREAREEPTFAAFFGLEAARAGEKNTRPFGKRTDADTQEGSSEPEPKAIARASNSQPHQPAIRAERKPSPESGPANFVIIFDIVNAAAGRIETAILSLGPGFRIAENVWTVSCELTAIGVRNALSPYLLPREQIFVIAATRGRTSWQNFTPEIHAKLAAAWATAKA